MSVLTVRDLRKAYGGVRAVDGVSFEVRAGELLALIGPNGAGKTTCFNLLNGQALPDAGSIELNSISILGRPPREIWRLGVGRTFQRAATFASLTVRENVQMALLSRDRRTSSPFSFATRFARDEAEGLLGQVGLREQAGRPCAVLAHGDAKRLELAIAIAHQPRLLLMDEPTAGMERAEAARMMRLADDLACGSGTAVLFTEHDVDMVFAHAHRVIVLAEGKLIAQGTPAQVRADPQVRAAYLGTQ